MPALDGGEEALIFFGDMGESASQAQETPAGTAGTSSPTIAFYAHVDSGELELDDIQGMDLEVEEQEVDLLGEAGESLFRKV